LLRGRGLIASIAALLIAWQAQLTYEARDLGGAGLYLLAASVLMVGYLFSYRNRRFFRIGSYVPAADDATLGVATTLRVRRVTRARLDSNVSGTNRQVRYLAAIYVAEPAIAPVRIWRTLAAFRMQRRWRLALGAVALLVSAIAVIMHQRDQLDWRALLLWAVSLALFAFACAGQRLGVWPLAAANPDELSVAEDDGLTQRRSGQAARREWLLLGLILLAAIWFRADGLSYSVIGIHSDEAEIGLIAKALLHGNFAVAPPLTSANWYYFPSGTMWTMLPGLALFGDDTPTGIHFSSALFSVLDIFALFLLMRLLWGSRPALIAAALLAGAGPSLHLSLYPAGTEQMALCWVLSFYFFFKGLRSKRYLDFVWSGYAAAASLFFYPSSRAILILLGLLIIYLIVTRWRFLPNYWRQLAILNLSLWLLAAPTIVYTLAHQEVLFKHLQEVSIFSQYGAALAFKDWGIAAPSGLAISPQAMVANWQLGGKLLLEQAKHTYLALNFYEDRTYFYQTGKPLLPTLPAMLAVLGIAYSLWRWRDPRYFFLNIWFWVGLLFSTMLTIHPPELLRMAGVYQVFYIFPAIALHKIVYEAERSGWFAWDGLKWHRPTPNPSRREGNRLTSNPHRQYSVGKVSGTQPPTVQVRYARRTGYLNVALIVLVALLMAQGVQGYYDDFRNKVQPWADISIDAYYLRNAQQHYHVYCVCLPPNSISFVTIRFLAPALEGQDVGRLTDVLPFSQPLKKDALFLVMPQRWAESTLIKQLYPGALVQTIPYITGQPFRRVYIVRASEANARLGLPNRSH
jgi:4-amino-4-deoxy-L-arabinose transferase-like glycosyltransferase